MCSILIEGFVLFAACLSLHVGWWRIHRPASYRLWLPLLVAIFLGVGPWLGWVMVHRRLLAVDAVRPDPATEWAAVMLLHSAASGVYIIGYTLVSAFSPSVEILKVLERTPAGLSRAEVDLPFLRRALSGDRVGNLLAGGLIRTDGGRVHLAPTARALTALVLCYRHLVGLPDGAGG